MLAHLAGDVLLAMALNNEPLVQAHGDFACGQAALLRAANETGEANPQELYNTLLERGVACVDPSVDGGKAAFRQILRWFDLAWVSTKQAEKLLDLAKKQQARRGRKAAGFQGQATYALELVLELTACPTSTLPLELMFHCTEGFARNHYVYFGLKSLAGSVDDNQWTWITTELSGALEQRPEQFQALVRTVCAKHGIPEARVTDLISRGQKADAQMLMHLVPVLVSTEANRLDPTHVVRCLNRLSMTQPDLIETIFGLVAARAQVIHSVWDGSYPAIDRDATPKVTVSSFTRALVVTAMGASGATVVACAGSAPAVVTESSARKRKALEERRRRQQQAGEKRQ